MHIFPGGQSLSEEQVFDKVFFFCVSITIVIVISIKKIRHKSTSKPRKSISKNKKSMSKRRKSRYRFTSKPRSMSRKSIYNKPQKSRLNKSRRRKSIHKKSTSRSVSKRRKSRLRSTIKKQKDRSLNIFVNISRYDF